jgi:hypothetical protein
VGRIVCVYAVLEQQLTAMRHALARVEPGRFTHEPVIGQIKAARALSRGRPHPVGERVGEFLDRASMAFERRNALVHSAFRLSLIGSGGTGPPDLKPCSMGRRTRLK